MNNARKPLSALIALGAALALPAAFAQDASTPTTSSQMPPTQSTTGAPAGQQTVTWADLDVDGNGTLSMTEAGGLPSLAAVFTEADVDGNGELTAEEYKLYVASANGNQPGASDGN